MEQVNHEVIKISVRNLVEFILSAGDIDNRHGGGDVMEAMQLGSKMHRKIQSRMGSEYKAEISLKTSIEYEEFDILVEGRADGIITESEDKVTIDEIKGVFLDLEMLEEPVDVHLAQGKCYAYIYAMQNELSMISVQMTYANLETEDIRRFKKKYEFAELEEWFQEIINEYYKWAEFQFHWRNRRNASIRETEFPFEYREGQKELVTSVYKTVLRKKRLFIQASTGVGKTIATLFPAVKAVGEKLGEKIFYLTAKTITRTVASEAFSILRKHGLDYKVVTLTAKDKICFCEETECNPDACSYAKGHYDRVNEAVFRLLNDEDMMSRELIEEYARKYQVCPFEMCLDVSVWVDAVICDYNYVFDPVAHLKRFFGEGVKGDYLFLIDEAHNLVERSREMYSAALYKESFLEIKRLVKGVSPKLAGLLERCNKELLAYKRECDTYEIVDSVSSLAMHLLRLFAELEVFMEECTQEEVRKQVLEFYFDINRFLYTYERLDDNYVIYTEHEDDGRFKVKLMCVDTADSLREYLDKGNSAVFFSATLLPIHYYKSLLGDAEEDYAVYAESTFPEEQRMVLMGTDVSSKYTRRNKAEYDRIADYIGKTISARRGNYIAFFTSYKMMEEVCDSFLEIEGLPDYQYMIQHPGMNESDREEFLEEFSEDREEALIAFCVMGGIFSEGIDLPHDRLIGAIIVGTGLPGICNEREILRAYYEAKGLDGFEYAYVFNGMNKVLQSAGRVIRTSDDKGVVLLLDERFNYEQYKKLFPREWKQLRLCNTRTVSGYLDSFWGEK